MASPETPFDWRGFWADLLQGTGRGLLTLDGSDVAQAAMTGLDYFDAAQARRAKQRQEPVDEDPEDPLKAVQEQTVDMRVMPAWRRYDSSADGPVQLASGPYHPAFGRPLGSMIPDMRPRPISANPYDSIELPAQVSFLSTQTPMIRRR